MADEAEDHQPKPCGIWPENARSVWIFFDLEDHWIERFTLDGPVPKALDRGQIKNTLQLMNVKRRRWPRIFNDLRVMETEAIEVLRRE